MNDTEILDTLEAVETLRRVLSDVSNQTLEMILLVAFTELKLRGIHYGLDGPYPSWSREWCGDAVWLLLERAKQKRYTIQPTPNPRSYPYEPSSGGPAGPDPDQSKRV